MWSDRYYYLLIYKDESLSSYTDTQELINFISNIPELEKKGDFFFKNSEAFPFTVLYILKAKSLNNSSDNDTDAEKTNLVSIVCSKGKNVDFNVLKSVFIRIAEFLNWSLVDECTDDEIENFIIWKPKI